MPVQRGPLTYRESGVPELAYLRGQHYGWYEVYLALKPDFPRAAAAILKKFGMRPDGSIGGILPPGKGME